MGRYTTTGPPGRHDHQHGRGSSSGGRGRIGGGRGRGRGGGGGRIGGRTNGSHYKNKPTQSKGTNSSNNRPDTTDTTAPSVTNSVQQLQSQMQLINNTIGNTLSLNAISTNKDCPKCIETTSSLSALQNQVREAMKQVEQMNTSISTLQNHATMVTQSLEIISNQVLNSSNGNSAAAASKSPPQLNGGSSAAKSPPGMNGVSNSNVSTPSLVTPVANANNNNGTLEALDTVSLQSFTNSGEKKQPASSNTPLYQRGRKSPLQTTPEKHPVQPTTQEKPSKSFRELMLERKKNGGASTPDNNTAATTTKQPPTIITTVDELITSCAPYLTGSPTEYTAWLKEELDIATIPDLAEAVAECPELLVAGNGTVGMWQKRKFCNAVNLAAAVFKAQATGAAAPPKSSDESFKSCQSSSQASSAAEGEMLQRMAAKKEAQETGDWACTVCTLVNPALYLACSACGTANTNHSTTTIPPESTEASSAQKAREARELEAKQKAEYKAKQEREAAEWAAAEKRRVDAIRQKKQAKKVADESRKRLEEEQREVAAEKQRRLEAKKEKQEAMRRHEAQQQQQAIQMEPKSSSRSHRPTAATPTTTEAAASSSRDTKAVTSRQANTTLTTKSKSTASKPPRKKLVVDKLSHYIKPQARKGTASKKVSPIFALIQNESTVEVGRKLLHLESETKTCRDELAETLALRVRLERGIKAEQQLVKRSKKKIDEQERKTKNKWNVFGLSKVDAKEVNKKLVQLDEEDKDKLKQDDDTSGVEGKGEDGAKEVEETNQETDKGEKEKPKSGGWGSMFGFGKGDEKKDNDDQDESEQKGDANDGQLEGEEKDESAEDQAEDDNSVINESADEEEVELEEKADLPTLEELIESCSGLLTGSPSSYISFLLQQKPPIKTTTDLGAAIITDDMPITIGKIITGREQTFVSTVLEAVSGNQPRNDEPVPELSQKEMDEKEEEEDMLARKKIAREVDKKLTNEKSRKRSTEVRLAKEKVDRLKKVIATSQTNIDSQKLQLVSIIPSLRNTMKRLQQLRADIADIKGDGSEEDVNFHIDRNRDDRGFTFLMIAAQNDDFFTAKTCFDLGADASATTGLEGLTAIDYSYFFGFEHVTNLILNNGGILPKKQSEAWASLESMVATNSSESKNWDDTLKVAETAALPAETLMESPETCENDKDKRMPILSPQECRDMDFTCFESRLVDSNINSDQVKRVVLLDQNVYNWCLSTDQTSRTNFTNLLEGLKPVSVRREGVQETRIHRRAIIGAATTFEVLSAKFKDSSKGERTALFTPFVSGEVNGITNIGVLVWTVAPDSEASLYKTLIANTEFMRHKVKQDDRFLPHKESVLELGKDMHLLDLQSTSIWTTSTMNLYILNLDNGDLDRIHDPAFTAKKRIVYSEDQVNKAIFRTSQEEANEEAGILASERLDMSSLLTGGAGTGKTLLIIKKVAQEDPSRKVLVVSRLSRLVNIIKTAVEERRDDGVDNQSFTTYDDLLQLLSRRVVPDKDYEYKSFVQFDRVRFDCDDSNVSFSRQFVAGHLNTNERREMSKNLIEELTLWHAIIVIKSQAKCATSKQPLSLDDYLALPASFGLTGTQRELCYALFLKYEQWRESERYWDEMDRVLYVLKFGPSVFKDDHFIPWAHRVNKFGQMDLLDDEGEPLYPFFYDIVCADEAQDFTEIDLILFSKMSASIRSLFLSADPAQSVELGVKMREGTVNDVIHSLVKDGKQQVKDVLQYISLQTNHRTHAQNLAIGQAVRRILARSFSVPITNEMALINGQQPKALSVNNVSDLADTSVFCGGNIVFLAPDEKVHDLRLQFSELGIQNDIFGVREAKGLEFDAVALIGFFSYIEERGSSNEWHNVLRWLSSSSSLTKTSSTGEKIAGVMLEDCDYRLSAPNVSDETMMLYTALTRARNNLYLIEVQQKGKKKKAVSLADFAFRRFSDLGLAKQVQRIDEGQVEMSAAQHKARGVLYVTQALNMSRNHAPLSSVKEKFTEAMNRFRPDKGDDKELFDKCQKHFNAVLQKHILVMYAKEKFLRNGEYNLEGRFVEVLQFEQKCSKFFAWFLGDSFLVEVVNDVRCLVEEIFEGTPYESHFKGACQTISSLT